MDTAERMSAALEAKRLSIDTWQKIEDERWFRRSQAQSRFASYTIVAVCAWLPFVNVVGFG